MSKRKRNKKYRRLYVERSVDYGKTLAELIEVKCQLHDERTLAGAVARGLKLGPKARADQAKPRKAFVLELAREYLTGRDGPYIIKGAARDSMTETIQERFKVSESTALRDLRDALEVLNAEI